LNDIFVVFCGVLWCFVVFGKGFAGLELGWEGGLRGAGLGRRVKGSWVGKEGYRTEQDFEKISVFGSGTQGKAMKVA
jgi:hypothetical protein